MSLDTHGERLRLRQAGEIDPLYAASELHNDVAKQRLRDAVANCEIIKCRADIKAKSVVNNLRATR